MRTRLTISFILNCATLGCLAFLLLNGRRAQYLAEAQAKSDKKQPANEVALPSTGSSSLAEAKPFHWCQVESTDYRTYMANLRGIGCPESTIRDIITADLGGLYASRRQTLAGKLATGSSAARFAVQRELQELSTQEVLVVTALLGAPLTAATTSSAVVADASPSDSVRQEPLAVASRPQTFENIAPSVRDLTKTATDVAAGAPPSRPTYPEPPAPVLTSQGFQNSNSSVGALKRTASALAIEFPPTHSAPQEPPTTITMPLVLQDINPMELGLNVQQAQVVSDLRQRFVEEVGGPNQDPNDPAYSQRWQASQPQADLDLCGMLGIFAFQSYQIAAWAKANAQTTSNP